MEGILTFAEVEEFCDINDLADANEALTIKQIIQNKEFENIK